jgi:hypothetical protein
MDEIRSIILSEVRGKSQAENDKGHIFSLMREMDPKDKHKYKTNMIIHKLIHRTCL